MATINGAAVVHGVRNEAHYLDHHAQCMAQVNRDRWLAPGQIAMRVEWGRWIGNCAVCGNALSSDPEWKHACCYSCGAVFVEACVFPQDLKAIIRLLARRPIDRQNWFPYETVSDLRLENFQHGLATR
jgi:hypothetical protein